MAEDNKGYIYIRSNESWDMYNAYKLGKTQNIPDREQQYRTSEISRGKYKLIVEVDNLDFIEKQLQKHFISLHIYKNAGVEFYNKQILDLIIDYFRDNHIKHRILSTEEIGLLLRKLRNNDKVYKIVEEVIEENSDKPYIPRDYQEEIIETSREYFQTNSKGLLVIPCGVGKTLISLWIAQKLNANTIIIGVPNLLLLKQWETIINIIFINTPYLLVSGNINIALITRFLSDNKNINVVITTYSSAYKVYNACEEIKYIFDMKINDEVHHLTSIENNSERKYIQMLNIASVKQLSLTATIKEIALDQTNIISNDNIKYFGEVIDRKCLLWAINKNIVCDYVIQTITANDEQFEEFARFNIDDKRLFLSAFASLKSIYDGYAHHIFIYSNNIINSMKIINYIKILLDNYFNLPKLYYSNYCSDISALEQQKILLSFNGAKYGIISCVYSLGEGFDCPLLDAVVFAVNMTSNIRIVQSALRASRKDKNDANKITKIILPIYDLENEEDLRKVKEVIYQMGLEDETIAQKIKVFKIVIGKQSIAKTGIDDSDVEYDEELTQMLRLKTIKRGIFGISYETARKIIVNSGVKNKEDYYKLCDINNKLSKEPEIIFKERFKSWIEYLSIGSDYYNLETCKNKVRELLKENLTRLRLDLSQVCYESCKIDSLFPPNGLWVEYYNITNLSEIIVINQYKRNKSSLNY
jgi:superfamily II DNA or RNA helicase